MRKSDEATCDFRKSIWVWSLKWKMKRENKLFSFSLFLFIYICLLLWVDNLLDGIFSVLFCVNHRECRMCHKTTNTNASTQGGNGQPEWQTWIKIYNKLEFPWDDLVFVFWIVWCIKTDNNNKGYQTNSFCCDKPKIEYKVFFIRSRYHFYFTFSVHSVFIYSLIFRVYFIIKTRLLSEMTNIIKRELIFVWMNHLFQVILFFACIDNFYFYRFNRFQIIKFSSMLFYME